MPRALILILPAVFLLAAGCRMPREIAAEVGDRRIAAAELEQAVRSFTASFGQLPPALEQELPRVRRGILERLIDRELMLAEATRRQIRPTAAEIERELKSSREGMPAKEFEATLAEAATDEKAWRLAVERDLTIQKLQEQITAAATVGEQEIADWSARHRDPQDHPEEVRASQILLRSEAEALEARRRIVAGAPFAEVARQVSLSPDADRGGDLGYLTRGQMPPEFDEVAFALPRGQLSGVVESSYGFHLFIVTNHRPARRRSAAEIREDARATLLAEKREAAFRSWLTEARKGAKIRYNRALVP